MDPAQYFAQGSSSHSNQQQDYGGNNQQLVRVDTNAVREYLRSLHSNTSQVVAPSGDPAFYQMAQQVLLERKHKTEQMILAIQQQAELANIMSTATLSDPGYAQNPTASGSMHTQTYQQTMVHPVVYQDGTWGNAVPNQWSYAPQGFVVDQTQHAHTAQISPQVEMRDLYADQRYAQTTQTGGNSEATISYQPQQYAQPQQQRAQPQQPQAQVQPHIQPQQQVQRTYQPQQSQLQQAAPVSQQTYLTQTTTTQTTQLYQPQPQHHIKRHPLQPDERQSQAESSQAGQVRKERDQAATTQRQLQYLALLKQQHQRPQQERSAAQVPQHQQSNHPQSTSAAVPPARPVGNATPASQVAHSQSAPPNPLPPNRAALPPTPVELQPLSLPPNESNAPPGNSDQVLETPSKNKPETSSPSKAPLRSTPSFSLGDLRASRRRSDRVVLASQERQSEDLEGSVNSSNQGLPNNSQAEGSNEATQSIQESKSNVQSASIVPVPVRNANLQSASGAPSSSSGPLKHGGSIMSSNISSNTPSAATTGPPPPPAVLAGSAPAIPAAPVRPMVPQRSFAPQPVPVASGFASYASAPASNHRASLSTTTSNSMPVRASNASQPAPTADPAPLKLMLERLHLQGIDCVNIVRRAAEKANAATDLLQLPSARTWPTGEPIALFAPGQPLQLWTQKLKVSKTQGEEIVKNIWSISRETMRERGLDLNTALRTGQSSGNTAPVPGPSANPPLQTARPAQDYPVIGPHTPTETHPIVQAAPIGTAPPTVVRLPPALAPAPNSNVPRPQPMFNVPPVQSHGPQTPVEAYAVPIAQQRRPNPQPVGPQFQGPPVQHSYQSHPIYQRPEMQAQPQVAPVQQPSQTLQLPQSSSSALKPAKVAGGGTPALDFLRTLGIEPLDKSSSAAGSDAGSDTSKGRKRKGKGKAKAVEEVASAPIVAAVVQPSILEPPAPEPSVPEPPVAQPEPLATQPEPPVVQPEPVVVQPELEADKGEVSLPETNEPVSESAAPIETVTSHAINTEISEPPPPLDRPPTPPSPLLAPTIAVLQEPRSPTTTASPLPEPIVDPATIMEHEDTPQPLAPQLVVTSAASPVPAVAPAPCQTPTPAPSPGPAQYLVLAPMSSPSAPAVSATDVQMDDLAEPAPSEPPQVLPAPVLAPAPRPASSASQRPPAPAEYAPLKRKRDSMPGSVPEPDNGPNQESWAVKYAKAANQLSESNRAKKARSELMQAARPSEPARDKGKEKAPPLFKPETPPSTDKGKGRMPLFRPETPPNDDQDESMDAIIDVVGDDAPRTVPPLRHEPSGKGKRRMIMEVVLPLRKKAKKSTKPQDLTMGGDDSESEGEGPGGLDEDEDEETEEDLKMLRRRLRKHTCKWRGCVGPAVLSSAELLGVHLNKMHGPRRDISGHYTCRWGACRMQYRRGKDLWEHVWEMHIIRPLWCPYRDCDHSSVGRYELDIHVRRRHRGRGDHELRLLARPEECAPSEQILRPEAFPADVPYFRLMGMVLRYNVLPASVSAQWHAKNGPKILRKISASSMSPVRTATPYVLASTPRASTSEAGGNLPAFGSPVMARPYVRLSTVPPGVLEDELEAVGGRVSPARSHITVHSDDETPPPPTPTRARGRPRGRPYFAARGRGRGRGGSIARSGGSTRERISAPQASTSVSTFTFAPIIPSAPVPQTPLASGSVSVSQTGSASSRAAPSSSKPRMKMFVELPSQGQKQRK